MRCVLCSVFCVAWELGISRKRQRTHIIVGMKKSLSFLTAVAVSVAVVHPAAAEEVPVASEASVVTVAPSDLASTPESEQPAMPIIESTTEPMAAPTTEPVILTTTETDEPVNIGLIVGVVVGVIALLGAAAVGVFWAVQQRIIANPLPGIIPNPPAPAPAPAPAPTPAPAPAPAPATKQAVAPAPSGAYYANCTAVWNALGRPIYPSDPGYTAGPRKLDGNSDGVGCEKDPR